MAQLLKGAPVAQALTTQIATEAAALAEKGVIPTLAILRVGENPGDLSYERGAAKRCALCGIAVKNVVLPADVSAGEFYDALQGLADDAAVHGILMFRPLPAQLDETKARRMIPPEKDVDGCTDGSLAGVFAGTHTGFSPCTAQAVMEMLKFYQVPLCGKTAAVIGRSLVVGRPVAMLLMQQNATVTICHTKTVHMAEAASHADILVACAGRAEMVKADCLSGGQVVVDVGINYSEAKQKLVGDVDFEAAQPLVGAISPVPGGVGTVTSAVLALHVLQAAQQSVNG